MQFIQCFALIDSHFFCLFVCSWPCLVFASGSMLTNQLWVLNSRYASPFSVSVMWIIKSKHTAWRIRLLKDPPAAIKGFGLANLGPTSPSFIAWLRAAQQKEESIICSSREVLIRRGIIKSCHSGKSEMTRVAFWKSAYSDASNSNSEIISFILRKIEASSWVLLLGHVRAARSLKKEKRLHLSTACAVKPQMLLSWRV